MSQSPIDMLSIRESWRMFRILAEIVDGLKRSAILVLACPFSVPPGQASENPLYAEGETIASCWSSRVMASSLAAVPASWKRATRELPRPEECPSACISSFPTNKNAISM